MTQIDLTKKTDDFTEQNKQLTKKLIEAIDNLKISIENIKSQLIAFQYNTNAQISSIQSDIDKLFDEK
jgi:hypothetical protein